VAVGVVAAAGVEVAVEVAAGVEAVAITGAVGLPGFTAGVAAGMAEAVDTMGLLPMVAGPTWVMDGVAMHRALTACTHADLPVTP
jgi:hypothetical protein